MSEKDAAPFEEEPEVNEEEAKQVAKDRKKATKEPLDKPQGGQP